MKRKSNSCGRWKILKGKYSVMFEKNKKNRENENSSMNEVYSCSEH